MAWCARGRQIGAHARLSLTARHEIQKSPKIDETSNSHCGGSLFVAATFIAFHFYFG
jgi:hypothetical protein